MARIIASIFQSGIVAIWIVTGAKIEYAEMAENAPDSNAYENFKRKPYQNKPKNTFIGKSVK